MQSMIREEILGYIYTKKVNAKVTYFFTVLLLYSYWLAAIVKENVRFQCKCTLK